MNADGSEAAVLNGSAFLISPDSTLYAQSELFS